MSSSAFMENLRQLFAECDTDNNGSLGREEFYELCAKIGLNLEAANETFVRLDIDKDDRITFDEFAAGFNQYKQTSSTSSPATTLANNPRPLSAATPTTTPPPPPLKAPDSRPPTPKSVRSSALAGQRGQQNLSPSSMSSLSSSSPLPPRNRKSASPLGVMSLGSTTGSSTNLVGGGGGGRNSAQAGCVATSLDYNNSSCSSNDLMIMMNNDVPSTTTTTTTPTTRGESDMVIYSSDMIGDYDQASGSGQFGSLMSSNGSFSQLRNMQDLLECVQKLQSENQNLSQIFFKDKREREEYISQLGEEFDQQVRQVEERANRRAKEELENEKKRLREMMQTERETLQHHYQTIEKMSKLIKSPNNGKLAGSSGESIDKVRSKLEDTYLENRQLKRSLLDTKTDVALIWKEMEKLKRQYEDKLSNAYERNNETRNECDHIKQQLNLMKDSNRKLQDASDVITTYITDKVEPVIEGANNLEEDPNLLGPYSGVSHAFGGGGSHASGLHKLGATSQSSSRRGSILSEYLNSAEQSNSIDGYEGVSNNSGDIESLGSSSLGRLKGGNNNRISTSTLNNSAAAAAALGNKTTNQPKQQQQQPEVGTQHWSTSQLNTFSSKNNIEGTLKETRLTSEDDKLGTINNQDVSIKKSSSFSQHGKLNNTEEQQQHDRLQNNETSNSISNESQSSLPSRMSPNKQADAKQTNKQLINSAKGTEATSTRTSLRNIGRHFFIGSRAQSDAQATEAKSPAPLVATDTKSISVDNVDEPIVEPADGPSKATYNIILVGDSFVGKSSFAARFMEGSFVQGLISNCSIDFKTKTYKVDGINYTINLWDTAGQERFRSITASYFRKADGIILMYDVTEKRSYLNVRNWMSTISDTASENVAVLLLGNKIDLRQSGNKDKCVPTEEGFRLAQEYEVVFLETSVKTGTNLVPSMGKLIRLIAKNNAPAEEDKDRIRLNDKSKMFNCGLPKNC